MVSDKVFNTDGVQKIYSSDFSIISEDHLRVFLGASVVSRDDYDLINNAAVFHTAPTTGQTLTLQVGTTPADILTAPTDAGIVAANITDVNNVADALADIQTILANMADINDVADDLNEAISEIETALANAQAAAASATAAALSETNAASSATSAAISATNAATSETNADTSATASATSATASAASATAASASESAAAGSATASATSATASAASATAAATSETNAATSATNASTSETNAATSATNAATSETNASTSESNASTSATNAATSATAAQAALDAIEGSYLGVQTSDPTLDLNGDPITVGDWYYNTTTNITRIYDGTVWQNGAVSTADFVNRNGDTMLGALIGTTFEGNFDGAFTDLCKNVTASTILKGTPVYQSGTAGNAMEVQPADASNPATMPAVGVLAQDLGAGLEGDIIHFGNITGVDTSSFSEGDTIYVAVGGGFTNVKPTGEGNLLQNLGSVKKVHATNGGGFVMGAGRANATPNLNDGNVFIGNASHQSVARALQIADTTGLQTELDGKEPADATILKDADIGTSVLAPNGDGSQLTGIDALPSQTGHNGKYLGTDGSTASWNTLDTDANSTTKGLYEHANTISSNYTIGTGNNAVSAGEIQIDSGVTVTVPTGSTWTIV